MRVGICKVEVFIPGTRSLKEKRGIIKSILKQLQNRFNISVAEVGNRDSWQRSVWGISLVSSEAGHVHQSLERVIKSISRDGRVQLVDYKIEII